MHIQSHELFVREVNPYASQHLFNTNCIFMRSAKCPVIESPIFTVTYSEYLLLLLLLAALQPLWVLACSSIAEYSQLEGFYRVPLPAARQTPNQLERSRCPPRLKRRERTPAAEGETKGEKFPRILQQVATSTSLLGSFTCRKFTAWDRRLYFPSEGRRAEDFFARKI